MGKSYFFLFHNTVLGKKKKKIQDICETIN